MHAGQTIQGIAEHSFPDTFTNDFQMSNKGLFWWNGVVNISGLIPWYPLFSTASIFC